MLPEVNSSTRLCISISARPGGFGSRFHNFLYRELGLNFLYKGFACTDAEGALLGMRALGIRGCGVSMPFKETVVSLLDELDDDARAIGAVNTIVRDDTTGRLKGYNTDFLAMRELLPSRDFAPETATALFGSGGMAKAVAHALAALRFRAVTIVSRNERTGRALAARYGYRWAAAAQGTFDQLINATSVGMAPDPALSIPATLVAHARAVCDVIANPSETPLVRLARESGGKLLLGTEITVAQGREQFILYTGVTPTPAQVRAAAAFAYDAQA